MKGKVITVIGNDSVFKEFLGRYGIVIDKAYGDKWLVEFNSSVMGIGGLSHTVSEKDFKVVGDAASNNYKEKFSGNAIEQELKLAEILRNIREFVCELFKGIVDKGGYPYINHLFAVENGVFDSTECRIVALLHDVLEDTDKTEDDLRILGVPEKLIETVKNLTRLNDVTYNDYIDVLLNSNDCIALRVKKADLEHNMDIRRIPNPSQKDIDRVEKRYKPAYKKICYKISICNSINK